MGFSCGVGWGWGWGEGGVGEVEKKQPGEWRRGDRVVVNEGEGEEGFLSSKQTGFSFFYLKFFLKDKIFFFSLFEHASNLTFNVDVGKLHSQRQKKSSPVATIMLKP